MAVAAVAATANSKSAMAASAAAPADSAVEGAREGTDCVPNGGAGLPLNTQYPNDLAFAATGADGGGGA